MKNLRVLFILLTIMLSSRIILSQVWKEGVDPIIGDEKAFAVTIDKYSNIFVTGYSTSPGGSSNFCTIMYDKNGVQQWVAVYNGGGNGDDKAYAITVDKFSNVYVTGYASGSTSMHDITTIKYNKYGVQQWVAFYNGPGNMDDEAYSIVLDNDMNVYVAGFASNTMGVPHFCVLKYDSAGHQQWIDIYNDQVKNEGKAYAITIDKRENIYVTGYSTSGTYDFTTIKYEPDGTRDWVSIFNGSGNGDDKAYAITVDKSFYVYVTGYSTNIYGFQDYATVKYNPDGHQEWVSYYNGGLGSNNKAYAIVVDKQSNVYITGRSDSGKTGNTDYATLKYNSEGAKQWSKRYSGEGNSVDIANSISLDNSENNVYVTGESTLKGFNGPHFHYVTIKYHKDGNKVWQNVYTGAKLDDAASQVTVDNKDNIYVTGYSYSDNINCDYATIKYGTSGDQQWVARYDGNFHDPGSNFNPGKNKEKMGTQGNRLNISPIPDNYILYQNYPNPFNPETTIKFSVPESGNVNISIYNILGEKVSVLLDGYCTTGVYEVKYYPYNLSSGVYFVEMTANNFRDTRKITLLK